LLQTENTVHISELNQKRNTLVTNHREESEQAKTELAELAKEVKILQKELEKVEKDEKKYRETWNLLRSRVDAAENAIFQ
jgi:predicted  nucleic acid-binding Zn-ribbon protein